MFIGASRITEFLHPRLKVATTHIRRVGEAPQWNNHYRRVRLTRRDSHEAVATTQCRAGWAANRRKTWPYMRGRIWFGCFGSGGPGDGGGGKGLGGRGSVGPEAGWGDGFVSMTLAIGPWRKNADNTINSIIPRFMIAPSPDG